MTGYTPPFPPRHSGDIPVTALLGKARRNLLEVWGEEMFRNSGHVLNILGQRILVCTSPAAIEAVLVTQAEIFARKPAPLRHALAPLLGDGLFLSEGPLWHARRAVVGPALEPAHLLAAAQEAVLAFRAEATPGVIDALAAMDRLAADMMCRVIFGVPAPSILAGLAAAYRAKANPWLGPLLALRVSAEVRALHALVDRLVARGCIMKGLSPRACRHEAISLFLAGQESIAGSLAWAWFLLAEAPGAEVALHAELQASLAGRTPGPADIAGLPNTRAHLLETLRLYPPMPLLGRVALRDTRITDVAAPAGSLAIIPPWVVHRHHGHWDAPDEFLPARFMPGALAPGPFAWLPFGLGPRGCPGQDLATRVLVLCFATLAQAFQLRLKPGHRVQPTSRLTLRPGDELPMILERRMGAAPGG